MPVITVASDVFLPSLARHLADRLTQHPRVVLGVASGATTFKGLAALRDIVLTEQMSLRHVHLMPVEIGVGLPVSHRFAFANVVRQFLQPGTDLPDAHIHSFEDAAASGPVLCQRYSEALTALGGFTIVLLGVGGNGHIAAIEPGSALPTRTYVSRLAPETVADMPPDFAGFEQVVTPGMADLLAADEVIIAANGLKKQAAAAAVGYGQLDPQWPLTFFLAHPHATFLFDTEACPAEPAIAGI